MKQHMNPSDIKKFVKKLQKGQDFIVGSRMINGAKNLLNNGVRQLNSEQNNPKRISYEIL